MLKPTLRFVVRPSPHGGYSTGIAFRDPVTNEEFFVDLSSRCGQPLSMITAVGKPLLEALIDYALASRCVLPLWGLLGTQPTCGGHFPTLDFVPTLDNLNAGLSLKLGDAGWARFAAGFTPERQGEQGLLTPYIDSVIDTSTNSPDHYTCSKMTATHGSNMRVDPTDPEQGLWVAPWTGGPAIRVPTSDYGVIEPSRIVFLFPAGLTGGQQLSIRAKINGSIRAFTYMVELTHS